MLFAHFTTVHPRNDTRVFHRHVKTISELYKTYLVVADGKGNDSLHNIKIVDIKIANGIAGRFINALRGTFYLFRLKPDIVQYHDPELTIFCLLLNFRSNIIFDVHENYIEHISLRRKNSISRKLMSTLLNVNHSIASRFFNITMAEDSYVKAYSGRNCNAVIHNYPDSEFFNRYRVEKRKLTTELRLVYIGSVSESRGFYRMVTVANLVAKKLEEISNAIKVSLDIVGGPKPNRTHDNKAEIVLHGRLPLEQAYELSKKASFGLCLLSDIPNYVNSLPTKMLEYHLINLPFFYSDFTLYKQYAQNMKGAIPVPADDSHLISNKIVELFINEQKYSDLIINNDDIGLTWSQESAAYIRFIKEVLDEK